MTMATRLAVIGGGNMARAIVRGALDAGIVAPGGVVVVEPDAAKRGVFSGWGIATTDRHGEALARLKAGAGGGGECPIVLLAVKPQMLAEVGAQLRPHWPGASCTAVSILAGTATGSVAAALGLGSVGGVGGAVVRAMPNTAASVRQSITAIAPGMGATADDLAGAERLFGALGPTVRIDESLMDAFTALAGSGPAYVFYLAEAMVRAGVSMGFDQAVAEGIVRQTIAGAGTLMRQPGAAAPADLRAAVTSKGGTTQAAVDVLDGRAVMRAVIDAVVRARDRGRELAAG